MTSTVLISGATGFIAFHTVQQLIKKGYHVVGSVRSDEKGQFVKENSGDSSKFTYEIVKDIGEDGAFDDFVKNHPEATVFLHTASSVDFESKDIENDILKPAINGTKNVLSSIKASGKNIKRVVITSSFAAIASEEMKTHTEKTYDESTWNDTPFEKAKENSHFCYYVAKTSAEKAAWEFVENEKPQYALTTIQPSCVFGPQPTDKFDTRKLNTSAEIINAVLKIDNPNGKVNPINDFAIDVRDVAKAHITAFEIEEAKGQRLILSEGPFTQQTILDVVHEKFPKETEQVPVGEPGSDKEDFKKKSTFNNNKTREILGFKFISIEDMIADSAEQILKVTGKIKNS